MGICAERNKLINSFQHPVENERSIYVFSDTPHLIKTIRNRLYNKELQVYSQVYYNDYNKVYYNPGTPSFCFTLIPLIILITLCPFYNNIP
jgi:hypothetical protein